MALTLETVENLAPDQASLKAASKLMKPAKWPLRGVNAETGLIWAECQGSGANPYRTMADINDHGYKCTCPSRKFPCKHVLALMWMYADDASAYSEGDVPQWVSDWVGRRRKGSAAKGTPVTTGEEGKSLAAAKLTPKEKKPDPQKLARQKVAAQKRAEETRRSVQGGLEELDQWIADQLRLGLAGFLKEVPERCRKIAARLVDAKAAVLARRLDSLPYHIESLRAEEKPDAVLAEFSKLVLLSKAWRADPQDEQTKSFVSASVKKETLLNDPKALRVSGVWEVLAERVYTTRYGMVSQSTWLLNVDKKAGKAEGPGFALLMDFFPAGAGQRGGSFMAGERFAAELVYYPSPSPLRAIIGQRLKEETGKEKESNWPVFGSQEAGNVLEGYYMALYRTPWLAKFPLLLPAGCLSQSATGATWWLSESHDLALPVSNIPDDFVLGSPLQATAILWDGFRCELLAGLSNVWGRISFNNE